MTVTPSPQSVVVPVEALRDAERQAVNEKAWATGHLLESIIAHAAPAPSSLAGGEVEAVARLMCRQHYGDRGYSTPGILNVVESDWPAWSEKAQEVLAALSPEAPALNGRTVAGEFLPDSVQEAPAREWVQKACADFQEAIDYFEADVADALAGDSERADLWDREVTVNIDALKLVMSAALRAQPQAREEAQPVAWVKKDARHVIWWGAEYPVHGEPGDYDALYTTPPSQTLAEGADAEKLREALTWALAEIQGDTRYENESQREAALGRALAVLQ